MDNEIINSIFTENGLWKISNIKKLNIWFTNEVYNIDDKYILKICLDVENEKNFKKEVFLSKYFQNKIPVPEVIIYDNSKKILNNDFIIYKKISWVNLYSKWHLLKNKDRKIIINNLCSILGFINKVDFLSLKKDLDINLGKSWKELILEEINNSLEKLSQNMILEDNFVLKIRNYVKKNKEVLNEVSIWLLHTDIHFDNILINDDNEIIWILDFERSRIWSIDFELDIIRRMQEFPKKYICQEYEEYAKDEDYESLMYWFNEFYWELFNFKNLEIRLNLYSINHDLDTLISYPNDQKLKEYIKKIID